MKAPFPTTKQAAIRLGQRLSGKPWYSSVGIAEEGGVLSLIVYSRRRLPKGERSVPESWDGLPVKVQQMGKIVPAQPGWSPTLAHAKQHKRTVGHVLDLLVSRCQKKS